jgi:hypothetical protein
MVLKCNVANFVVKLYIMSPRLPVTAQHVQKGCRMPFEQHLVQISFQSLQYYKNHMEQLQCVLFDLEGACETNRWVVTTKTTQIDHFGTSKIIFLAWKIRFSMHQNDWLLQLLDNRFFLFFVLHFLRSYYYLKF